MSFQADIADALLETLKGCVANCDAYERVLWTLGDPAIDCSTLGIGLQSFPVAQQVATCAVNELRLNIVVGQCCYPLGDDRGNPPTAAQIREASACVLGDVERIMCCLRSVAIEIPGLLKPCRPTSLAPVYSRPSGGCVVAKIGMVIAGVPCCESA